eukprot:tig00020943_g16328.t1
MASLEPLVGFEAACRAPLPSGPRLGRFASLTTPQAAERFVQYERNVVRETEIAERLGTLRKPTPALPGTWVVQPAAPRADPHASSLGLHHTAGRPISATPARSAAGGGGNNSTASFASGSGSGSGSAAKPPRPSSSTVARGSAAAGSGAAAVAAQSRLAGAPLQAGAPILSLRRTSSGGSRPPSAAQASAKHTSSAPELSNVPGLEAPAVKTTNLVDIMQARSRSPALPPTIPLRPNSAASATAARPPSAALAKPRPGSGASSTASLRPVVPLRIVPRPASATQGASFRSDSASSDYFEDRAESEGEDEDEPGLARKQPSFFPLDNFDDADLEERPVEERMEALRGRFAGRVPARSRWHTEAGRIEWRRCDVLDHDPLSRRFVIRWEANGRQKAVSRLNLLFEGESLERMRLRRRVAAANRREAERWYRYQLRVDALDAAGVPPLAPRQVESIRGRVGPIAATKRSARSAALLMAEADAHYVRSLCRMAMDAEIAALEEPDETLPLIPVPRPPVPEVGTVEDVRELGVVFAELLAAAEAGIPWGGADAGRNVVTALHAVIDRLAVSETLDFFASMTRAPYALSAFSDAHAFQLEEAMAVAGKTVLDGLRDIMYSAVDLEDLERHPHERLRYVKLAGITNRMFADRMRSAMLRSLRSLEAAVRQFVPPPERRPRDLSLLSLPPHAFLPLFSLSLVVDGEAGLRFEPPLEAFTEAVARAVENALAALNSLHTITVSYLHGLESPRAIEVLPASDPAVQEVLASLRASLATALEQPRALLALYDEFRFLAEGSPEAYVADRTKGAALSVAQLGAEVDRLRHAVAAIDERFPTRAVLDMFAVNLTGADAELKARSQKAGRALCESIASEVRAENQRIADLFAQTMETIAKEPQTTEELFEQRNFLAGLDSQLATIGREIENVMSSMQVLDSLSYTLDDADFTTAWRTYSMPASVEEAAAAATLRLESAKLVFAGELSRQLQDFQDTITAVAARVDEFVEKGDVETVEEFAAEAGDLQAQLAAAEQEAELINSREKLFGNTLTDFAILKSLVKSLEPYATFWKLCADFQKLWQLVQFGQFTKLDAERVEREVSEAGRTLYRLEKFFVSRNSVAPQTAAVAFKKVVDEVKVKVPLLVCLRTPGLRDRHWEKISGVIGQRIKADSELTFAKCLALGCLSKLEEIQDVADVAAKEYSLERSMDRIVADWKGVAFAVLPYRSTGTSIVSGTDEIIALLEEHLIKVQSMRGSPFVEAIREKAEALETKLSSMQEILDEWLSVQKVWLYLEPIFGSPDIMRQMPQEGSRFAKVDKAWRTIMEATTRKPVVWEATNQENLLLNLQDCNRLLDLIQKGMNEYLETKRIAFPRFYFLSNDELLEILAQTKDPLAVQPHLSKCFENVQQLEFQVDLTITAMLSAEKERVALDERLNPNEGEYRGNVELWLLQVERLMKAAVRARIGTALGDYSARPRVDWVLAWPGQVVLAVNMIEWTRLVEEAIGGGGGGAGTLAEVERTLTRQLDDIVSLVRGDLTYLNRLTLGALVVIDVHARDVVAELRKHAVGSLDDFDWVSQLRYYWDPAGLKVRMVNASIDYGYEYLGNTARLVITPLTDRCYRTLMGALHLNLGGAPEGPAGTGKTETTKDLAKAIAKQCVVFNCSDGLDYIAMGKFFKGLAQGGAWACFDEFNRIDLEVLSVIAQQILTIQRAVAADMKMFKFEGSEIKLDRTCAVFITMNPGYAGRSELPDNLKALFRPVAMMVPDYAMISEISLYSYGFSDARNIARKIVACLRLSSEQLSSQDHYDFGMRNVKSILTAAGQLKRKFMEENETVLGLRAIRDCNVPKFTAQDIPLFDGIVSDLFPGVESPEVDYSDLHDALRDAAKKFRLQPVAALLDKATQLYETIFVRHGLMLVGRTYSGKSSALKMLSAAMTACFGRLGDAKGQYAKVKVYTLNPKSITQGQLYGEFSETTHEWRDGVLANTVRLCATDTTPDRKWVVFDGPVDAVWIENMNTVLDDNKKLCLNSGEIIKLTPPMTMMFEVEDLAHASPATVSRCGMVFMEPGAIGWRPLLDSWLETLPLALATSAPGIAALFEWLVPPTLRYVRRRLKQPVPVAEASAVRALIVLYDALLCTDLRAAEAQASPSRPPLRAIGGSPLTVGARQAATEAAQAAAAAEATGKTIDVNMIPSMAALGRRNSLRPGAGKPTAGTPAAAAATKELAALVDSLFVFALVWSVGANVDAHSRKLFSDYLRYLLAGKPLTEDGEPLDEAEDEGSEARAKAQPLPGHRKLAITFPEKETVYDWSFDRQAKAWEPWLVPDLAIPAGARFHEIIVPTKDTVRFSFLFQTVINHHANCLVTGPTGTGKSLLVRQQLSTALPAEKWIHATLNFSARTSANQTQTTVFNALTKRRKGHYGPPFGKRGVIFVDDMNMPAPEQYGAQPPLELLRQMADHNGFYDTATTSWIDVADVSLAAAMGPPGGGRNPISGRLLRHFVTLNMTALDDESTCRLFGVILNWSLHRFPVQIRSLEGPLIAGTVELYNAISAELLPTPAKSHYLFNLRDLGKVFQGVLLASEARVTAEHQLARLWYHECERVFHDRLVSEEDRKWFHAQMAVVMKKHLNTTREALMAAGGGDPARPLVFGDFLEPGAEPRVYDEVPDAATLSRLVGQYLDDYNAMARKPMHLVLFQSALLHCARICRVIRQPFGHALLVGVGGSGRRSLTRLAAHVAEFEVHEIEISKNYRLQEWRDDLKKMMSRAGGDGRPLVFLLSDMQIVQEAFLEDVNNLLNAGEVPNLFAPDELQANLDKVAASMKEKGRVVESRAELQAIFVERCRSNLHVVLAMSPAGDAFRNRLRMFPSLVSCTTIDWFTEWPHDALLAVASYFLEDGTLEAGHVPAVAEACVFFHERVQRLGREFARGGGISVQVTPSTYLELIGCYLELLRGKRREVSEARGRYEKGLEKLLSTAAMVGEMQVELEQLRPLLQTTKKETEELLVRLERDQKEAETTRVKVTEEEIVASRNAAAAAMIREECASELKEAMPALREAERALKALKKNDVIEMKSMKSPPAGVKLVMEAVCILLDKKPKKEETYWDVAKRLLGESRFVELLMDYDKDNIPADIVAAIAPFIANPEFQTERVNKSSKAAGGICKWVRAVETYNKAAKIIAPKRAALKEAEQTQAAAEASLAEKKATLQAVEDRVRELLHGYAEASEKKRKLEEQVETCTKKLERAHKLIGGLGGEKDRWIAAIAQLGASHENLAGDALMAAGAIAYLGPFDSRHREAAEADWLACLRERGVPCSAEYSFSGALSNPVDIRAWNIFGLPADPFSVDNAVIVANCRRYPLLVDPQGQAGKWIKNMEKARSLMVLRASDGDLLRSLETAVGVGIPVLVEAVGEELDPALDGLLLRQTFKSAGTLSIRLGDKTVDFDPKFRLYLTSRLRSPHFSPEAAAKVTLVNFAITPQGLTEQLLGIVVRQERPDLEEEKNELIVAGANNKRQLREIEDTVLRMLSSSQGNILEDEALIQGLAQSKSTSIQIATRVAAAETTEKKIDETREVYRPVAARAASLFFCISDLATADPMYQYSLAWFIAFFAATIAKVPRDEAGAAGQGAAPALAARLASLSAAFRVALYRNVCRSLFERHKLLFSVLLCLRAMGQEGDLEPAELAALLAPDGPADPALGPAPDWLGELQWRAVGRLAAALDPAAGHYPFPPPFEGGAGLSALQRLLLVQALRGDLLVPAARAFVAERLGGSFVEPPPFDLAAAFAEAGPATPLLFVLSPGADPAAELLSFAESRNAARKFSAISLGQGQGAIAEKMITEAAQKGLWLALQNCHLAASWMPALEVLFDSIAERAHHDFRLWLTSAPSAAFPVSLLQASVKMTNEPPRGLRANLTRSYLALDDAMWQGAARPREFRRLLFSLCFFHAVVQERRKFGPLGWNVPYEFNESDLRISSRQLRLFLDGAGAGPVPFKALTYLTGQANYGGRVTDDHDRRLLATLLADFYDERSLAENHLFAPPAAGQYPGPPDTKDVAKVLEHIARLPASERPGLFGLHENAEMSFALREASDLVAAVAATRVGAAAPADDGRGPAGPSFEELVSSTAQGIAARLPPPFDIEAALRKYPPSHAESLNTVLVQELVRFNRLTEAVRGSLADVAKALRGALLMSAELEDVARALHEQRLPRSWAARAYPSLKPLGAWTADLVERLHFFEHWLREGPPPVFWLSGFFFTQSFLTGVLQNAARRKRVPVDELAFRFAVLPAAGEEGSNPAVPPSSGVGCYVRGLFVEGARWDPHKKVLAEQRPKELAPPMPAMLFEPVALSGGPGGGGGGGPGHAGSGAAGRYACPVYKTSKRHGVLSTTGHSTNYVLTVHLPSDKHEAHWIKRSVALITQLDY